MAAREAGEESRTRASNRLRVGTVGEKRKSRRFSPSISEKKLKSLHTVTEPGRGLEEAAVSDILSELGLDQILGSLKSDTGIDGAVEYGEVTSMTSGSISISNPVASETPFIMNLKRQLNAWKENQIPGCIPYIMFNGLCAHSVKVIVLILHSVPTRYAGTKRRYEQKTCGAETTS
jgi:hypothetical protein